MSYNGKNYTEQGGEVTHICGKLVFDDGAEGVMPNQEAATGTSVTNAIAAVNALLIKLKNVGYFVRWVAADLVLAGNNKEKSKDTFTIWADGYQKATYKLKIVEPST